MSKQNKVNPGSYTQAGRLSQDDVAREVKKQREVEPVERRENTPPHHAPARQAVTDEDKSDDDEGTEEQEE